MFCSKSQNKLIYKTYILKIVVFNIAIEYEKNLSNCKNGDKEHSTIGLVSNNSNVTDYFYCEFEIDAIFP